MKESDRIYSLKLSDKEVEGIGYSRYMKAHKWKWMLGFIGSVIVLCVITALIPQEWNDWLRYYIAIICISVFAAVWFYTVKKAERAGKELLKAVMAVKEE